MTPLIVAAIASIVVAAVYHLRLVAAVKRRAMDEPPAPPRWPKVAVMRPVRGLDVGAEHNTASLFELDYPGEMEIAFLLDDAADPSHALISKAIAEHPHRRARILIAGEPPPNRTGKINKMIHGVDAIDAEVYVFTDSDTRPAPHAVRELVAILYATADSGIAFAPAVAVAESASAGDIGYSLLVNAWYGPAVRRLSGRGGRVPFAMGQLMAMRKTALDAIGGMRAAEGQLVDDMFLGRSMGERGYINLIGKTAVPVVIGGMGFGDFLAIFRKWIFFSWSGLPSAFKRAGWARAATGLVAWAILGASVATANLAAAALSVIALMGFVLSQTTLTRALGGAPVAAKHWWLAAVLPFVATAVAASTVVNHEVGWRGRRYRLDTRGRLKVAP